MTRDVAGVCMMLSDCVEGCTYGKMDAWRGTGACSTI
jgi:hypothetical protein